MISVRPGLGTRLRRLLTMLDGEVQAVYDRLGVPYRPRFHPVTRLLLERAALGVNEIAQLTGVSQPAATQTIGEMKRLGLVEIAAAADRRARRVELTDKGERLAAALRPVWDAVARAADALEEELPAPLTMVVDATIEALVRDPFAARVRRQLSETGVAHDQIPACPSAGVSTRDRDGRRRSDHAGGS